MSKKGKDMGEGGNTENGCGREAMTLDDPKWKGRGKGGGEEKVGKVGGSLNLVQNSVH